ncbi:MAG: hypothetical protein JNJ83_08885 [Verrucomicrobiaceae bacterium]|nr:hypothetical protein [Verrucomicrobiaceae bacterium]
MKCLQSLLLAMVLHLAHGQVPLSVPALKDAKGSELKNVVITEAGPDGIKFVHSAGVGKLAWDQVPAELRQKLGWSESKAADLETLKKRISTAESALQTAATARAEAMKKRLKPALVRFTCNNEATGGTDGILNGKAAIMLGILGQKSGTVLDINAFKLPSRSTASALSTYVPVDEVEIPGLKADREKLAAASKGQGGEDTMIGGMEINKRRAELTKANTASQLIRFRVTELVYNGVLGVCDVGGALVWVIGANAEKGATITSLAMPDGEQTVGGKKYRRFVTVK